MPTGLQFPSAAPLLASRVQTVMLGWWIEGSPPQKGGHMIDQVFAGRARFGLVGNGRPRSLTKALMEATS